MKIAVCVCTWNRPKLLGRMIRCFEMQDYENRVLLVLDDAGQYPAMEGDRWKLVSHRFRWPTLGEKRNAAISLLGPDVDAYSLIDDDDLVLPHHLSALVVALQEAPWCQSRQVLVPRGKQFQRVATSNGENPNNIGYPGGWGFRREAFERLGGYAAISNGEDQELAARALKLLGPSADTITDKYPTPGYVYDLQSKSWHLSAMGPPGDEEGYRSLGKQHIEPVESLNVSWPEDYCKWPISDTVLPRRW